MANGDLGDFSDIIMELQSIGVFEIVLPFFLIFTLVFAILQKIKLFGEEKKGINMMIAVIVGILTVVPHVTGNYPANYDPILIINTLLPSVGVLSVAIILILFLWGMFGGEWIGGGIITPFLLVGIFLIIGYIFGTTVGWWAAPSDIFGNWWGPKLTTTVIIILIFGVGAWMIAGPTTTAEGFSNFVERIFRRPR